MTIDIADTRGVVDDLIRDGITGLIALGTVAGNKSRTFEEKRPRPPIWRRSRCAAARSTPRWFAPAAACWRRGWRSWRSAPSSRILSDQVFGIVHAQFAADYT